MQYTSTRDHTQRVSASEAILRGIAPDGGLYVPTEFPSVNIQEFYGLTYPQTAEKVLGLFLTDYDPDFLKQAVQQVYSEENFGGKAGFLAPVAENLWALELWHGPTCAFKDYALQLMPRLLMQAKKNLGDTRTTKILVATSGDTGKAALSGYAGLPGIRIAVFYPNAGTSEIQRLQMATQEGENVAVYAVNGNFDDTQTGVKRAFADRDLTAALEERGETLSSANSINWGRLVPQIVYYFYSYANLVQTGAIQDGAQICFCVPTGNFGDILAGYYARQMGLPIKKLICASNKNKILTDFLSSGIYDVRRCFYKTTSPSMDILISSNLERLLYHITQDDSCVKKWMNLLVKEKCYTVPREVLAAIQTVFDCGFAEDEQGSSEIHARYEQNHYLCDTHTAIAMYTAREKCENDLPCVVLSTASPYKFPCAVLQALGGQAPDDEFEAMRLLHDKTGVSIPKNLAILHEKAVRFTDIIEPEDISQAALRL